MILFEPHPQMREALRTRLSEPVPDNARHLVPIWRAVADSDVTFATVFQNDGRFTIPDARPAVVILGDDLDRARGPMAFSARSLRAFLPRCAAVAFVGCEAMPIVYANAARMAVDGRHTVAIIESQPEHEKAWLDLVDKIAPKAELLVCRPFPRSMAH